MSNKDISIHLQDYPNLSFIKDDTNLESDMDLVRVICSTILSIRDQQNLRVRLPLQSMVIIGKNSSRIMPYSDIIADEVNVKSIECQDDISNYAELKLQINFKKVGAKYGPKMKDIIKEANNANYQILANNNILICKTELHGDEFELKLIPRKFDLNKYHIEALPTNDYIVKLDIEITKELQDEGIARDLVRIIQQNRKEADFDISDRIKLSFYGDDDIIAVIKNFKSYICQQVLANDIEIFSQLMTKDIIFENSINNKSINIAIEIDK